MLSNKNIKIKINDIDCMIPKDYTILQACEYIGIEIPRFCYHRELLIAGNCRMCLVELEKSPKPVASCAMQIMPGMSIYTDTPLVRKAREGVLEFLLINHPLDCPICDQGGECDLQDQSVLYGSDRSRFYDFKRSVEDKNCGPLIKTIMTRCIHCTRCVRFIDEVAGHPVLGTINRGNSTEISTYIDAHIKSELSGNLIDLCPVGALTSKPYAFRARSWELKNKSTLDLFDSLGSNTITNIRGTQIMRILPAINAEVNREWISDKARFAFDAYEVQRLVDPLIWLDTKYIKYDWKEAVEALEQYILWHEPKTEIMGVCGQFVNLENSFMLKNALNECGVFDVVAEKSQLNYNSDFANNYIFKDSLTDFSEHDLCFIVGANLKHEAPVLNSQLRKRYIQGNFDVYTLGENNEKNFESQNVGLNLLDLIQIVEGSHPFSKILAQAANPCIIVGGEVFENNEAKLIHSLFNNLEAKLKEINPTWNSLNILHKNANDVGLLELGFSSVNDIDINEKEIIFLVGTENFLEANNINYKKFTTIYIGHHGTKDSLCATVSLPCLSPIEESGIYVNTEGRAQFTDKVAYHEIDNRSFWSILQMLLNNTARYIAPSATFYETYQGVRNELYRQYPLSLNSKKHSIFESQSNNLQYFTQKNYVYKPFKTSVENFYLNDLISKHSPVMGQTSQMLRVKQNFK